MIDERRIKKITDHAFSGGVVLYWMNRDMRADDNWALLHAREIARAQAEAGAKNATLMVWYNLVPGFLSGNERAYAFKVAGLKEVEEQLHDCGIPFLVTVDETGKDTVNQLEQIINEYQVSYVVTDMSPLRIQKKWVKDAGRLLDKAKISFDVVDAHNCIPVWITSDKQEFAARTIRPKIHRLISEFLVSFPKLQTQKPAPKKLHLTDWKHVDSLMDYDAVGQLTIVPGAHAAHAGLKRFLHGRLEHYDTDRNDPNKRAQSGLSPYLHYGMIAPARVALEVLHAVKRVDPQSLMMADKNGARGGAGNASAFLEELIVRRELADNFCYYNDYYDSPEGFADWAKKSHAHHARDNRDYVYTKKQFERAETHDALWNAAQLEMVKTGKMHGYMRMYWAKKILEWTPDVATAMKIAIELNDKYELDGRDPNGYAGIAWSIGGTHDRPWFTRPIFGQIRYMSESGCRSKFDVDAYVAQWTGMF